MEAMEVGLSSLSDSWALRMAAVRRSAAGPLSTSNTPPAESMDPSNTSPPPAAVEKDALLEAIEVGPVKPVKGVEEEEVAFWRPPRVYRGGEEAEEEEVEGEGVEGPAW